ncbi:MAG: hypothetical protein ACRC62_33985, partial [Microcoleus sp.]
IEQKASIEKWAGQKKARTILASVGIAPDIPSPVKDKKTTKEWFDRAIEDLAVEAESLPGKSKEGCYNAMAGVAKIQQDLFPPSAEELAKIAADLGIRPADFIRALQKEWTDRDAQAS